MKQESAPHVETNEEIDHEWDRLQNLLEYLRSIGLRTRDISRDYFDNSTVRKGMPTPIVFNGADGIRMSYEKRRGLMVWFTNGFEDPENETRKKVREYWNNLKKQE